MLLSVDFTRSYKKQQFEEKQTEQTLIQNK